MVVVVALGALACLIVLFATLAAAPFMPEIGPVGAAIEERQASSSPLPFPGERVQAA